MGIGLLAGSAAVLVIWLLLRKKRDAIRDWPSVDGRIVSSGLVRDDDKSSQYARVLYSYSVAGAPQTGSRIALAGGGERSARAAVDYYRPGNPVQVFYDPRKPSSSVLEREMSKNVLLLPFLAAVFALAGVIVLIR